ncbi:hypothetical protein [Chryseobacterium arthrosphaerae]|uniref:Uncharacterized protein n=1 Tax=Chryseobacterium arthrosphaerae TaxID=651561 RepID=A0A1B8ZEW9_9FLAO|nr:hypothetical protein [Chryseobacterium arthrosphaerae]AYZ10817.1 hypothetical protein EGY05_02160 [Chryseobacterium arthrosphaerae]OCA70150.1 hypothetical protein BBI00_20120 [Chryseobacterium arthrosphaerae]
MILIDYLYYQFTNFYYQFEKDGTHRGSGIILTGALLCWNLVFFIIISDKYFNTNLGPSNKYVLIIYCLPIILFLGLRYSKFTSYEEINEKVQKFSKTKKTIADILLIIYVIISLPVFIIFGIYLGSLKN